MLDSERIDAVAQSLWHAIRHLAAIAPAASFWTSGIGVGRSLASGGVVLAAYLLALFVSTGVMMIKYRPVFERFHLGLFALIIAPACAIRELLLPFSSTSLRGRLVAFLESYCTTLWIIAIGFVLVHIRSPGTHIEPDRSSVVENGSYRGPNLLGYVVRGGLNDHHDRLEKMSSTRSFYLTQIAGPASHNSSWSGGSVSSLSLSSDSPCPDSKRTARIHCTIDFALRVFGTAPGVDPDPFQDSDDSRQE